MTHPPLYLNDKTFFPRLLDAIHNAKEEILISVYAFHADKTGREFIEALTARARAGVTVRVLFDSLEGNHQEASVSRLLRKAGIEARIFRPSPSMLLRHPLAFLCRNHTRIFLFDRTVFGTGSTGLANAYRGREDLATLITTPNTKCISEYFEYLWKLAEQVTAERRPLAASRDILPGIQTLFSGPRNKESEIYEWVLDRVRQAKRRIVIMTPFFFPPTVLFRELVRALERGIVVDCVTPLRTDKPRYDRFRALRAPSLMRKGARWWGVQGYFHEKFFIFDDYWTFGSANFDIISLERNYELNLWGEGGRVLQELERIFESAKGRATSSFPDTRPLRVLRRLFLHIAEFFFLLK